MVFTPPVKRSSFLRNIVWIDHLAWTHPTRKKGLVGLDLCSCLQAGHHSIFTYYICNIITTCLTTPFIFIHLNQILSLSKILFTLRLSNSLVYFHVRTSCPSIHVSRFAFIFDQFGSCADS